MSEIDALSKVWLPLHFAFIKANQIHKIKQHFGSLEQAVSATLTDWKGLGLITEKQAERLFAVEMSKQVEQALTWQSVPQQQILSLDHSDYPSQLKNLDDAPLLLYAAGDTDWLQRPQVAVVGSRNASKLGLQAAKDFAKEMSQQGITVTSGMASGIDSAAHQGALQGIGKTIAVVGTGLDRVYPASNRNLAKQIVEEGLMLSEFALGTQPKPHHFPLRNRIISGLSKGVLVVEAALNSGSLITARMAMEQGREVFAVPGSIHNPNAKGCHQLIKQGAKLVESGQDIYEELAFEAPQQEMAFDVSETSTSHPLLDLMEYEPVSLDELVVLSKMAASEIQVQMTLLELEDKVVALSAARWQKV